MPEYTPNFKMSSNASNRFHVYASMSLKISKPSLNKNFKKVMKFHSSLNKLKIICKKLVKSVDAQSAPRMSSNMI